MWLNVENFKKMLTVNSCVHTRSRHRLLTANEVVQPMVIIDTTLWWFLSSRFIIDPVRMLAILGYTCNLKRCWYKTWLNVPHLLVHWLISLCSCFQNCEVKSSKAMFSQDTCCLCFRFTCSLNFFLVPVIKSLIFLSHQFGKNLLYRGPCNVAAHCRDR